MMEKNLLTIPILEGMERTDGCPLMLSVAERGEGDSEAIANRRGSDES